ncbi:hypothetical protein CDD80_3770 [Ophiocordyceps camponoti-rufipedis]|uniref:FAM50A/XAP5 C-terminal domain-containing protein n=1 Tax=Ophiocordyceps camponoti-rufipedis TaxID=2004952 RepID=A0A2C5ZFH4_9HYPO|nr:hypothetical protein CDD80_3770 [Ophiocordyceps camponoti-rufipedis]
MADQVSSRFAPQKQTTHERLSNHTVGLVALSDFRKRRAEVLEQQEREAREAAQAGGSSAADSAAEKASGSDGGSTPKRKKKKKDPKRDRGKKLLSFGDDDDDEEKQNTDRIDESAPVTATADAASPASVKANAAVGVVPRAVTKAALLKEATERETLRREFMALQEAVKATEIAIPFVFYDGAHIPGGTVRLKKGDFVWVFLDRCRKVGAGRKVGENGHHHRRGWARAGVDDLMLVRDTIIIPHHYDFYYFVMNKIVGPGGRPLFDYSAEAPESVPDAVSEGLAPAPSKTAAALPDISTLEGAGDDARMTKVVDRRWYARNKHIYPASTWQEFEADKDYANEIRKDTGGNTFFFSS